MAIKRAYKIAYKMKWHPDKNMDNVEEATDKKKSVVAAYECIGTAGARLKYGQALHAPSRLRLREARRACAWRHFVTYAEALKELRKKDEARYEIFEPC